MTIMARQTQSVRHRGAYAGEGACSDVTCSTVWGIAIVKQLAGDTSAGNLHEQQVTVGFEEL
jgi:hypothetical protein